MDSVRQPQLAVGPNRQPIDSATPVRSGNDAHPTTGQYPTELSGRDDTRLIVLVRDGFGSRGHGLENRRCECRTNVHAMVFLDRWLFTVYIPTY